LLMEYDEQLKEHFPTRLFEDASMAREYIDEYDDQTFWDELINRLTDRDIEMMLKRGEIQKPQNREERFAIRGPIERRYAQEFERNGLDNVVVNIDQQINEAN